MEGTVQYMKVRRLLLFAAGGILVMVAVIVAFSAYWDRKQAAFQNLPQLIAGLQMFLRDRTASGLRVPPEISLQDLVRGGYLAAKDVRAFEGMEVVFSTEADSSRPQSILARARMQDGQVICVLADGSVQQYSPERYQLLLNSLGQPGALADPRQPGRSQTNRASAAAGSGR